MTEQGSVASVRKGAAVVRLSPGGRCDSCPASGGCHANVDLGLSRDRYLSVNDPLGVHRGDRVEVFVPDGQRLRAGLVLFGLPALTVLTGAIVGGLFGGNLATGLGLGAGLALGIGAARLLDRAMERRPGLRPSIVRVLPGEAVPGQCH